MEIKIPLQKKCERSEENSLLEAKQSLGFVKHFKESAKGIYKTCNSSFFNLALIIAVVFSIIQSLFLHFASNN